MQFAAQVFSHPPAWLPWASPALVLVGLFVIWASVRFNVWSQKQKAIDALAEQLSEAIHDLTNTDPVPTTAAEIDAWEVKYHAWIARVSKMLENRAFFTRADQLHFDRLGYITPITMHNSQKRDWLHSQLKLKFDRLRDVINWSQARAINSPSSSGQLKRAVIDVPVLHPFE